jgi:enoyl-CoA hydratase
LNSGAHEHGSTSSGAAAAARKALFMPPSTLRELGDLVDYSSFTFIDVEVRDGIAVATLDHDERLNAVDFEEHQEFGATLRAFAQDSQVSAVVLRSVGRSFSVGGSFSLLENILADEVKRHRIHRETRDALDAHITLDKPVITALSGYALGSGAVYALMADFVIAERHVTFGDGHIGAALVAADGGAMIWPLAVGMVRAKKYLLTGDMLDAEEAERIGLVTEVVETGESFDRAMALARRLADGPQSAIRYTKRSLNQWYRAGHDTTFELADSLAFAVEGSEEARRGYETVREGGTAIDRVWTWRR